MPTATSTPNTIFRSADAAIIADQLARGSYQRDLVAGNARWSGADLRGDFSDLREVAFLPLTEDDRALLGAAL